MQLPKRKPGKYTTTPNDPLMTQDKFDALEIDLERLKQKRPDVAKEVTRLAELGDFSENVEYQQAKGRLRGINNRILKMEYQLNHAEIIEPGKDGRVVIGSTVTVEIDGNDKTFTILGSSETDPSKGIISHSSPIGSALIGKNIGNEVEIEIGGLKRTYKILEVT
jgi:transcription elongation factor GreA